MSEQNKDSSVFGIVNMESIQIPPRNYLISLSPMGIGTAEVECLSSYIARLAWEYFVSPQMLLKNCVEKYQYSSGLYEISPSGVCNKSINSFGKPAKVAVASIEMATNRQDITHMTLLRWREVLGQTIMKKNRAWCANCFQSDLRSRKPVYERLLWKIGVVKNCVVHQQRLVEVCPHCKGIQNSFSRYPFPGFCGRCKKWLGNNQTPRKKENTLDNKTSFEIGKLVSTSPKTGFEVKSRLIFAESVDYFLMKSPFFTYTDMTKATGISIGALFYGVNKPSLLNLVKINKVFSCSITDFLLGKKFNLILRSKKLGNITIEVDPHQMPKPLPIKDVLSTMEKHLASDSLTHNIYEISKIVNHEFGALRIISPELERSLSKVYAKETGRKDEHSAQYPYLHNVEDHALLVEIIKILKELKAEGIEITEDNIRERLGIETKYVFIQQFWFILRIAMYDLGYMNE